MPHYTLLLSLIYPSYVSLREVLMDLFIWWGLSVFSGGGWPGGHSLLGLFESSLKLLLGFWMLDEQKKHDLKNSYFIVWSSRLILGNCTFISSFFFKRSTHRDECNSLSSSIYRENLQYFTILILEQCHNNITSIQCTWNLCLTYNTLWSENERGWVLCSRDPLPSHTLGYRYWERVWCSANP